MERVRKKVTINFTTSPSIVEKMDSAIEEFNYAGRSDFISNALAEYLLTQKLELMDKSILFFLSTFFSDRNSKKQLLDIIPENKSFKVAALLRKAKACIELGELDEAQKCLEKAKELETKEFEIKELESEEQETKESENPPSTSTRKVIIK